MQHYSYIITLRIGHPTLDVDLVSQTLGLEPNVSWRAGDPRKTPRGTPLDGARREGYWTADPFAYGWRESTDALIEDALQEFVTFLEPHHQFLKKISEDGYVRIWIGSHSNRNYAFELAPGVAARLASLGATLIHDVYQGP